METISFEDIKQLFKETDRKFQENEKRWKEIHEELAGIGKSNGEIAEDFFYTGLESTMQTGKLKFDYIDRNFKRKRNNTEAQYDIILYNNYKVLIVEVKYNFKNKYLQEFYKNIKKFRTLFPEYSEYKIYGAIAGLTIEEDAILEAKEYGFFILTQNNQNIQIQNEKDFEPKEIR